MIEYTKQLLVHPMKLEVFEETSENKKTVAIRGDEIKKTLELNLEFLTNLRSLVGNPVFYGDCPPRKDSKDLFIYHFDGKVHWKTEDGLDAVLAKGDVLYIPKGIGHEAKPLEPQLAIAFRKV